MRIDFYQVDAFTDEVFKGNPAGVCPLDEWLPDDVMQTIAFENNLSETAFFVREDDHFDIRWFTPLLEIDLCGHATLASAYILYTSLGYKELRVDFRAGIGPLPVKKDGDVLFLDLPSRPPEECEIPDELVVALGRKPEKTLVARDYLLLFPSENAVREITPDFDILGNLDRSVIISALGEETDFVSRFFAPTFGIPEDPVTGSSHCTLIPYWAERLSKSEMTALQVSKRGGKLYCKYEGDRVKIGGKAVTYLEGSICL